MIEAAIGELEQAGITERLELALADAGYWNEQHMDEVLTNKHIQVLIPPGLHRPIRSRGRGGPAGATHGCEPCSDPTASCFIEDGSR